MVPESEKTFNIQEAVDDVLNDSAKEQFTDAAHKLKKIQDGIGCTCHACKTHAVSEVNTWVDFVCGDEFDPTPYFYHLDENGDIYRGEKRS